MRGSYDRGPSMIKQPHYIGLEAAVKENGVHVTRAVERSGDKLRAGHLVAVLVGWNPPPGAVNVLMPPGRPRASRVAVLLDFLIRRFAAGSAPWTAGLLVAA
jgi:DNA-binding transcriptional LysR family regulator